MQTCRKSKLVLEQCLFWGEDEGGFGGGKFGGDGEGRLGVRLRKGWMQSFKGEGWFGLRVMCGKVVWGVEGRLEVNVRDDLR